MRNEESILLNLKDCKEYSSPYHWGFESALLWVMGDDNESMAHHAVLCEVMPVHEKEEIMLDKYYCGKCKHPITNGFIFCPICGNKIKWA